MKILLAIQKSLCPRRLLTISSTIKSVMPAHVATKVNVVVKDLENFVEEVPFPVPMAFSNLSHSLRLMKLKFVELFLPRPFFAMANLI